MITVVARKVNTDYLEENFEQLLDLLPVTRREYVLTFKQRHSAIVELAVSLLLNEIVKQQNEALGALYDVSRDLQGKPFIPQLPDFYFNISHSGDYVVVAYGDEVVGVDVQKLENYREKVALKCCNDQELAFIGQGDIDFNFTFVWTIKEAYAKYTGKGLGENFKSIAVDFAKNRISNTAVQFVSQTIDNHVITICAENINNTKFCIDKVNRIV